MELAELGSLYNSIMGIIYFNLALSRLITKDIYKLFNYIYVI